MNIAIYGRVSTNEQNEQRQLRKDTIAFIDRCSGSIPFFERPQAKRLISFLKSYPNTKIQVLSVDRIGRSTLDILSTVKFFKENNYQLVIENLGMTTESPFFDLMISLLGTLAEHERQVIKERCKGGIEIAKQKGIYTGRKLGTVDDRKKVIDKHQDIVLCINSNMKTTEIERLTGKSRKTISKVKRLL
jgi:DNA invertase Pin-like site-specific DNA recombinase